MKTRNQIFWVMVAIINGLAVVGSDQKDWMFYANSVLMVAAGAVVWWHTLPPRKSRREGHRRG